MLLEAEQLHGLLLLNGQERLFLQQRPQQTLSIFGQESHMMEAQHMPCLYQLKT
jgi:hypothetical protein